MASTTEIASASEVSLAPRAVVEPTRQGDTACDAVRELVGELQQLFGVDFSVLDAASGDYLHQGALPPGGDDALIAELARAACLSDVPEFLAEEGPILVLALPMVTGKEERCVAVGTFVTRSAGGDEDLSSAGRLLGLDPAKTAAWINRQPPWTAEALVRLGAAVLAKLASDRRVRALVDEVETVSAHLAQTYEEISLLHGVTRTVGRAHTVEQLLQSVPPWLIDTLPVEGIAIQLRRPARTPIGTDEQFNKPSFYTWGKCPITGKQLAWLAGEYRVHERSDPLVVNEDDGRGKLRALPGVFQLVAAPLAAGGEKVGLIAAVNHAEQGWFGTVEASILQSVGAILGLCVSTGQVELYRRESQFLGDVVRAFMAATDARDPYTSGHSERVAYVAARLAQHYGCDRDTQGAIFVAGLLHDLGKIGVDDRVLRKSGKLTGAECDHLRKHPQLGVAILSEVRRLKHVFPIILHHHEHWDGSGYPGNLQGEQIPLPARILAVADTLDAMTSDRPYRRGLSQEHVKQTLRMGAGVQWDPAVVEVLMKHWDDVYAVASAKTNR